MLEAAVEGSVADGGDKKTEGTGGGRKSDL